VNREEKREEKKRGKMGESEIPIFLVYLLDGDLLDCVAC